MFIKAYKVSGRRLLGISVMFVAAVALLVYGIGLRIAKPDAQTELEAGAKLDKKAAKGVVKTDEERLTFVAQFGWQTGEEAEEIAEIVIPEEFDEVYIKYNEMQKKQGYDLEKYRGKRCKRYTYAVLNYPDHPDNVRVNLMVLDGKVIAGDVCSTELDGFMHGFDKDSVAMTQAQELPLPQTQESATVVNGITAADPQTADPSAEPPIEDTMAEDLEEIISELQAEE